MVVLDLMLIAVCCVIIIDLSGFVDNIKNRILKILGRPQQEFSLKPFDCSFCSTHWIGLIWIWATKEISLMTYTLTLLMAFLTPLIKDLLVLLKDLTTTFLEWIYFKLNIK